VAAVPVLLVLVVLAMPTVPCWPRCCCCCSWLAGPVLLVPVVLVVPVPCP